MKLSDISPISALKVVLEAAGVTGTIYEGSMPTAELPDSYIVIMQNGGTKIIGSKMGLIDGALAISIYVKLLSTGAINIKKSNIILKQFDSLFENNKTVTSNSYHFSLDTENPIIYEGRNLSEGYSTKIINILLTKY